MSDSPLPVPITLAQLPLGGRARILGHAEDAPKDVSLRLRNLGFRAGNVVEARRRAPLNDPIVYRLLGYDMCLRNHEARHITVTEL
ncbi:MAG: FeoA family protein [Mycolicibacterium insubricum]|nr:ferrous iron transport protein A [Mycobacterium sp.]